MPKKIIILFIFIFMLFNISNIASADNISLKINNEVVTDNLEYQLENQTILIPIDILTDYLPIKKTFYSNIQTLKLETADKEVKLRVGEKILQFNNSLVEMPAEVKEIDGRIYAPLEKVIQALGLMINSQSEQQLVEIYEVKERLKEVNHIKNNDYEALEIVSTEKIDHNLGYLDKPNRIVFDLKGTIIGKQDQVEVDSDLISRVRVAQYNGNTTRVVLDLSDQGDYIITEQEKDGYYSYLIKVNPFITGLDLSNGALELSSTAPVEHKDISYKDDPYRAVIDIKNASLAEEKEFHIAGDMMKKASLKQYQTEPSNMVRMEIELKEGTKLITDKANGSLLVRTIQSELESIAYDEAKNMVNLNLTQRVEPKVMTLSQGNRLVFDFPDTLNEFDKSKLAVDNNFVEEIRVSQFSETVTRVVLDLNDLYPYELNWKDSNLAITLLNQLNKITASDGQDKIDLALELSAEGNYVISKLLGPPRLVVDIMDTAVDIGHLEIDNQSELIENIRSSQYSNQPKQTRVVFDLSDDFEFEVESSPITDQIRLAIARHNFVGQTIVLDAGHGGVDPGAIGYSGLKEKDVALDITLKLANLLEEAGFNVILTRDDDTFVDLAERIELANQKDADAFLSIHANAHRNQMVSGTETFVAMNANQQSKVLAELMQDNVVAKLGTIDRGVKEDRIFVLSNAEVPAVLTEPAFLSNQVEEEMLRDKEKIEDIATALYQSFIEYFQELTLEEAL